MDAGYRAVLRCCPAKSKWQSEIGAESDRVLVARERLGIAALLMTNVAELIMRVGECREFCKRELELCGGFVESARSGKRNAVVVAQLWVVRQQTHRRLVCSQRFGDAPGVRERAGKFAVWTRAIGPFCDVVLPNRNGRAVIEVTLRGERAQGNRDCNEYDHAAATEEMPHANDDGGNDGCQRQIHAMFRDGLCREWQHARSWR